MLTGYIEYDYYMYQMYRMIIMFFLVDILRIWESYLYKC